MSDEFLKIAIQEIQTELDKLETIISHCNDDEQIFRNCQTIKDHLHKIRGLAPMIGQEKIGEIAKTSDNVLKYILNNGVLAGSCSVLVKSTDDMKKIFQGSVDYDLDEFKKMICSKF